MENRFCWRCGARFLPDARFCTACGAASGAVAPEHQRRFPVERYAPAAVVGVVLLVAAIAIFLGNRHAAPPAVVPPRNGGGAGLPAGHPPIQVPDDVRAVIDRMADTARKNPKDLDTWKQLGFVQYRAGQVDAKYLTSAEETYKHVLELDPKDLDALRALGNIDFDREQPEQAMGYYRRYLELKPDDLHVQTDLGTMMLSAKQTDAAIKTYRAVLKADPEFFQAQFNLAIAYRAAGQDEKALDALRHARDLAGDDATRKRVDELLARLTGEPPPEAAAQAAPPAGAAGGGGIRADVESIFRSHPITGPKLERIDWPDDQTAKVVLRQFPMEGMPPFVRQKFVDHIRQELKDKKARDQVKGPIHVDLVDADTGRVMETISE
jgi:Flp pilus assembly protein TadD